MYGYLRTEGAYLNWIRSALRRVWSKHPIKLGLVQKHRYARGSRTSKRAVFHVDCFCCGKPTKLKDLEVNHKNTVGELTLEDFGTFADRLLNVTEKDLDLLCKPCHSIITYAERYTNGDIEEAKVQKKAVAFSKKPAVDQKKALLKHGVEPAKTAILRREQAVEIIRCKRKK